MSASWSTISSEPASSTPTSRPRILGSVRRTLQILDVPVGISAPPELAGRLGELFSAGPRGPALSESDRPRFEVVPAADGSNQILLDGQPYWESARLEDLVASLEWAVNNAALTQLRPRFVMFHAGAVAGPAGGLLLPAASGSGKSTLTAALVLRGARYLSDEVAVIEPESGRLRPFAKSICLKSGGRRALARLHSELTTPRRGRRFGREPVWFYTPPPGSVPSESVPVRFVVLPRFQARATTRLIPISRAVALPRLLEQSFNLRELGPAGMERLIATLRDADCFQLTFGSLRRATDLLLALLTPS